MFSKIFTSLKSLLELIMPKKEAQIQTGGGLASQEQERTVTSCILDSRSCFMQPKVIAWLFAAPSHWTPAPDVSLYLGALLLLLPNPVREHFGFLVPEQDFTVIIEPQGNSKFWEDKWAWLSLLFTMSTNLQPASAASVDWVPKPIASSSTAGLCMSIRVDPFL